LHQILELSAMFWFIVFTSFLGADIAQMKSTLMLGPFGTEVQCWATGASTVQRIATVDPDNEYRGACFKPANPAALSVKVAESASLREFAIDRAHADGSDAETR
jgi:hypothetical protein